MNAPAKIEAPKGVYAKIAAITGILAREGIAKSRKANFGNFRGIDDVYNALAPLLAEHRLSIMPRMVAREVVERKSSKGNALFYTTVEAEFDFVSADDHSIHVVCTYGEAMDTGDKATTKAMSAAYKAMAFMTFCVPTEGDNDTESQSHEVSADMPADIAADLLAKCEAVTKATGENQVNAICQGYNVGAITDLTPSQTEHVLKRLDAKLAEAKETADA